MIFSDKELLKIMEEYQAHQSDEAIKLYRIVEKIKPKIILEIGCLYGGSLKLWSTLFEDEGLLVGLDTKQRGQIDALEIGCEFHYIKGNSHLPENKEKIREILKGRHIDFLFHDGDHSTEGAGQDYEDYSVFVRSGGIIAFHDIQSETSEFWLSLKEKKSQTFELGNGNKIGYLFKN